MACSDPVQPALSNVAAKSTVHSVKATGCIVTIGYSDTSRGLDSGRIGHSLRTVNGHHRNWFGHASTGRIAVQTIEASIVPTAIGESIQC